MSLDWEFKRPFRSARTEELFSPLGQEVQLVTLCILSDGFKSGS